MRRSSPCSSFFVPSAVILTDGCRSHLAVFFSFFIGKIFGFFPQPPPQLISSFRKTTLKCVPVCCNHPVVLRRPISLSPGFTHRILHSNVAMTLFFFTPKNTNLYFFPFNFHFPFVDSWTPSFVPLVPISSAPTCILFPYPARCQPGYRPFSSLGYWGTANNFSVLDAEYQVPFPISLPHSAAFPFLLIVSLSLFLLPYSRLR